MMLPNKKNPVQAGETLRPPTDTAESSGELLATSDLYSTIKNGTASLDNLRLLVPGFEIIEELGRGAFGVVYRARDEKLDRQVAVKISLLDDPNLREQYIKEAKSAAKLDHPGIVPVYQVGAIAGGQPFVVQRLIDGTTLRKMLAHAGPLSVHHACWLMTEIARAVAEAHAVGMIHRDLKPDNILLDSTGKPWVADFGLAILEEEQREHRGEKAGTPLYMSPEQLQGRAEWLDGRADIYAMGIMLYEMLVGRTPFDARNLAELEEQVLHREPKPISQRSPNIPTVMDVIFQNCSAKQVHDRYSNAYELVADLEAVMAEIPEADTQPAVQVKSHGLGSVGSRKSSRRVGVSTRRKTQRSTMREEPMVKRASRFVVPLVLLGLVAGGAYKFWPTAKIDPALTNTPSHPDVPPERPAPIPAGPFRVSKGPEGTHKTIREALAHAQVGDTITILPGDYNESLSIDRSVTLVGEGKREAIVITGENNSAMVMKGDFSVVLSNLTIRGSITDKEEFNTIDVVGSRLTLNSCEVYSRSYDCVKVRPGSGLKATDCNFISTAHPAIHAEQASVLEVVDCIFDITQQTREQPGIPHGVQAIDCSGLVKGSTFFGSGEAKAIHFKGAKGPVSIEGSKFDGCGTGVILQDCVDVRIQGSEQAKMLGCMNGIVLERSVGVVENMTIDSFRSGIGIRVINSSELPSDPIVQITDCQISGFNVSLSVEHSNVEVFKLISKESNFAGIQLAPNSKLQMNESDISGCVSAGVLIEDAVASLLECDISNNDVAGIILDGLGDALNCVDCNFHDNTSGLLMYSGSAQLHGGAFQRNGVGIAVISRQELRQVADPGRPDDPIHVDMEGVAIIARKDETGMLIKMPCSFRIVPGSFADAENKHKPKIVGNLKSEPDGEITRVKKQDGQKKTL